MGNVTSMAGGKLHTRDICPRALTMFAGRTQGRSKPRRTKPCWQGSQERRAAFRLWAPTCDAAAANANQVA
jgi:hypothetical protein